MGKTNVSNFLRTSPLSATSHLYPTKMFTIDSLTDINTIIFKFMLLSFHACFVDFIFHLSYINCFAMPLSVFIRIMSFKCSLGIFFHYLQLSSSNQECFQLPSADQQSHLRPGTNQGCLNYGRHTRI